MTPRPRLIREGIRLLLLGNTIAGDQVVTNRATKLHHPSTPALVSIYTLRNPAEKRNQAPPSYFRDLEVALELFIGDDPEADELVDDRLEDFVDQVEELVLGGWAHLLDDLGLEHGRSTYDGVDYGIDPETERFLGDARMTFTLSYDQEVSELDLATTGPLDLVHTEMDVPPADDSLEIEDDLDLTLPAP